jgi:hypothetical protein
MAAEHLRVPRKTLYDKMYRHGIDVADFRKSARDTWLAKPFHSEKPEKL